MDQLNNIFICSAKYKLI